ncbi:MAG: hypothetical protein LCH78_17915 [Proteobacteria bacterium]|nr:hypothetical protein [Pseudomonadota bacterium]
MSRDLQAELAAAEGRVEMLKQQIATGACADVGHAWEHIGGRNAGCSDTCACSVPVHVCAKCGDSDYGENDDASVTRDRCRALYPENHSADAALVNGEGGEMALRTITLTVDQAEFFDHVSQHGLINSTCPIGSRVIACLLGGVDWREAMGLGVYGVSVIEEAPATPTKETSNG